MEAKGNGNTEICTRNLMRIFKGEVPYSRKKGIDQANVSRPVTTVIARLSTETRKMIEEYEPRAVVDNVKIKTSLAEMGYLTNTAELGGGE